MGMANKNKVRGMLLGIAAGDALGMPVEGFSREKIFEKYPQGMRKYEVPDGHKWFSGQKAGTLTDDTNFTICTMQALIEAKCFDMDVIARHTVEQFKKCETGCGGTTREAIRNLMNGVSWRDSGKLNNPSMGWGNGVPMKIAPLAAFHCSSINTFVNDQYNQQAVDFSLMTHYTVMSAQAAVIHMNLIYNCLWGDPITYSQRWDVLDCIDSCFEYGEPDNKGDHTYYDTAGLIEAKDDFKAQMQKLYKSRSEKWDHDRARQEFGNGNYYVFNSLPFSYHYFMRNPRSVEAIYEAASAGGDTDSNASMVGALVGALNGIELFEKEENKHLLDLDRKNELIELADEFCETFVVEY